jgi:triosephosphate isomerase (TIM)
MIRPWVVAGNWKMNNGIAESSLLARAVLEGSTPAAGGDIVLAPPLTSLAAVAAVVQGSHVKLAAQNVYFQEKGAFTGEVSPSMLKNAGCAYVILGHSERRKYFHESDEEINLKVKAALAAGLRPILCVGETEEEREKGVTEFVVGIQVAKGLSSVPSLGTVVIAYEPVWAIGTGKTATPGQAEEVHRFIRGRVTALYPGEADRLPILYGGSVTPENSPELMAMPDIDGALVGGASLKAESFLGIIKATSERHG